MAAAWYFWEAVQYPLEIAANMSGGSFHELPPICADMGGWLWRSFGCVGLFAVEVEAPACGAGGLGVLAVLPVDLPVDVLADEDADESEVVFRVLDG